MDPGYQFEAPLLDGDIYKVNYSQHFARRFDIDDPDHPAVRRTVEEAMVRQKIEEAIPKIDAVIYGKSMKGVIVSRSANFVMLFDAVETDYGRQLNMVTMSGRVDFKPKSAKEVIIKVNPVFNVLFSTPISLALKVSILADISINWQNLLPGTLYHLGGEMMDYWLERSGNTIHIPMADWNMELMEIEVS